MKARGIELGRLEPLLGEVRTNARLRLGLYAIAFIFLIYLVLSLSGARVALRASYVGAVQRYADVERIAGEHYWPGRASDAKAMLVKWEQQLWHAGSPGLAQADFQAWLNQLAGALKLNRPRVDTQSAAAVSGHSGIWSETGSIEAGFDPRALAQVLAVAEGHRPRVQVVYLHVQPGRLNRMRVRLQAYFSNSPAAANSSQQSSLGAVPAYTAPAQSGAASGESARRARLRARERNGRAAERRRGMRHPRPVRHPPNAGQGGFERLRNLERLRNENRLHRRERPRHPKHPPGDDGDDGGGGGGGP